MALLTVALGLVLMAASTYAATAAKRDTQPAAGTPTLEASAESLGAGIDGLPLLALLAGGSSESAIPELAGGGHSKRKYIGSPTPPALTPTPPPTVELHYAAPLRARGVGQNAAGGANLSPEPRVWNVTSVRPSASSSSTLVLLAGLDLPPDQLAAMQRVSLMSGIPWQIFAGIAKVESDFGRNMSTSWAGAIGYGQFMPAQWQIYGNGGDPYDYNDVLPAMARYLLVAGVLQDVPGAIYAYNHSWDYVALVLGVAASYGYPDANPLAPQSSGLIWPAIGPISTYFGPNHQAIDIDQTARPGAPMLAAHDGVVYFAGGDPCCSYGYYVVVVGPAGVSTLYAHFESIDVRAGQTVRQGQPLGAAGCTGLCTGTHLHFEVFEDSIRQDPLAYLPAR